MTGLDVVDGAVEMAPWPLVATSGLVKEVPARLRPGKGCGSCP